MLLARAEKELVEQAGQSRGVPRTERQQAAVNEKDKQTLTMADLFPLALALALTLTVGARGAVVCSRPIKDLLRTPDHITSTPRLASLSATQTSPHTTAIT